jgi:hypothetical protein
MVRTSYRRDIHPPPLPPFRALSLFSLPFPLVSYRGGHPLACLSTWTRRRRLCPLAPHPPRGVRREQGRREGEGGDTGRIPAFGESGDLGEGEKGRGLAGRLHGAFYRAALILTVHTNRLNDNDPRAARGLRAGPQDDFPLLLPLLALSPPESPARTDPPEGRGAIGPGLGPSDPGRGAT